MKILRPCVSCLAQSSGRDCCYCRGVSVTDILVLKNLFKNLILIILMEITPTFELTQIVSMSNTHYHEIYVHFGRLVYSFFSMKSL